MLEREYATVPDSNSPSFDLPSYQQAVSNFLLGGSYRNLSPRTLEFYAYHLLGFQRYLTRQNQPLSILSFKKWVQEMVADMAEQGRAHDTMAGRIRSCRCFYHFLYPDHKWKPMPIPLSKGQTVYEPKICCFTPPEIHMILERPDQQTFIGYRDYVMMLIFLDTGIRLTELSHLQLNDVLLDEQCIRITMGKNRKLRFVPIGSTCLTSLQSYIELRGELSIQDLWVTRYNKSLQRGSILKIIRMYCRGAIHHGTRGSAHTFRHTMAKLFLMNGGSVYALQHILGHSTLEMTRKYVCLFENDLQVQHEKWSPIESLRVYAEENSVRKELRQWK